MVIKSFIISRDNINSIVNQCLPGVMAIIRPNKALVSLFRSVVYKRIVEKKSALAEVNEVKALLSSISADQIFQEKQKEFIGYVLDYLGQSVGYSIPVSFVEDYILAQCSKLLADVVAVSAGVEVIDGRDLVVCYREKDNVVFDWQATRSKIEEKCANKPNLVIAGGYARTPQGDVVGVGKGGADMMASLVASSLKAEAVEFFVDGDGINGIPSMTYDEAAHYCASKSAPFPSAALWPAKQAGIPIVVKSISNYGFAGTMISSKIEESGKAISGIVVDEDLVLITVYGTGLLGTVGTSSTIFSSMAKAGVSIRFISQTSSEYSISFAVRSKYIERVSSVLSSLVVNNPLLPLDDVMIFNRDVAILTVYGSRMKNVPGTSSKVFSALEKAGINVIASAQGGEELSISVVIDKADLDEANQALKSLC